MAIRETITKEADVNHRYSLRKSAGCKVTLSCNSRIAEGQVLNLSIPGCQVETSLPLKEGHCVQLRVQLANQSPMRVDLGIVRWINGGKAGIEFIRMSEEDQKRLRWYVGYVEKRVISNQAWSEPVTCTGMAGV
jgi:PilZ domain.